MSEDINDVASTGGVWNTWPYEQVIDGKEVHRFLVYRKTPLLEKEYAKKGDYKIFYMAEKYLVDSVKGIRLIPKERVAWELASTLPDERMTHNELWNAVKRFLREHLDLVDQRLYDVTVAWIFASYTLEKWPSVPYLFFMGPVKSGKTRALECLQHLCYRGVLTANISVAALYRLAEDEKPTILLDEAEIYNSEHRSEIIGLLNSGYRRGQHAIRAREDGGPGLRFYKTYCFKAFAGTRGFKDTLESRSIIIIISTPFQSRK